MKTKNKMIRNLIIRLAIIFFLTTCANEPIDSADDELLDIPVQSIEFISAVFEDDPTPLSLKDIQSPTISVPAEITFALTAKVKPDNASNQKIFWFSNNTDAVTVGDADEHTNEVTTLNPGTSIITIIAKGETQDGAPAIKSLTIKVSDPDEIGVSAITLDPKTLTFTVGDEGETLTAEVLPADADNKNLLWSSDNTAVAVVESTGSNTARVEPKAAGTATISVRSAANNVIVDTCSVTVTNPPPVNAPAGWIGSNDRLTVDANGLLRNRQGQEIVLRGTNLGGWTLQESWMCPIYGKDQEWANLNTIEEMEKRGWLAAQIQELFDQYQSNWITVEDFDWLQKEGVNFIRVSFWYRNFMSDDKGNWINNDDGSFSVTTNPGFKLLDWAFSQAAKRGIYVCLMMHGAVGGQSTGHGTGTLGKNELYTNPAYEQYTVDLWKAIVNRYKDEPAMAVLDLLGEPNNNLDKYSGTTNNIWLAGSERAIFETVRIYDRFYREIRAISTDIILDMEAIWWAWTLPDPKLVSSQTVLDPDSLGKLDWISPTAYNANARHWAGKKTAWENVMYSMHLYDDEYADVNSQMSGLIGMRTNFKVAIMNGEFNNDSSDAPSGFTNLQHWAYKQMNDNRITWASWTYKVATNENQGNWSPHRAIRPVVNPMTDDIAAILDKWGTKIRTWQPRTSPTSPFVYNIVAQDGYVLMPDAYDFWITGLNHALSGVWTKSTASGFPVGGTLGPITAAAAAKE